MTDWKPISEAPRTGDVLVYCEDTHEMLVACWSESNRGWLFAFGPYDGAHICTPQWYRELPKPPEVSDAPG